ncbi:MAG: hypothetical protein KKB81_03680 [Candidatus Margulisbacteria bacterium]|nr:hypothetical protein [Candidatus Margulisiibacteriota bacterium]MBU1021693.1 hypothetical protein [Candidatus Margulisiibacteriota bacterium]MBU1729571.1 hypothetical protein [Candidatus Margulisiibacteriota bacterium]MBU1955057.1 hypothetical protein [Candidatus Margulisiibacteriota bacterium]
MTEINIQSAPEQYKRYLTFADAQGNYSQTIDNQTEATQAAEEFCKTQSGDCQNFLEYLESFGFRPQVEVTSIPPATTISTSESEQNESDLIEIYPRFASPEISLNEVENLEESFENDIDTLRQDAYRHTVSRLINRFPNAEPQDLYALFYHYNSNKRAQAISNFKASGIYEAVEICRAQYLMYEILGKHFDDQTNAQLLQIIDASRFENFGWLWQTTLDGMIRTNEFNQLANQILARSDVRNTLSILKELKDEDLIKIFNYIGEPDHYFISMDITEAGSEAAEKLAKSIKDKVAAKIGLTNRSSTEILALAARSESDYFFNMLLARKAKAIPSIQAALNDSDPKIRFIATRAIYEFSVEQAHLIPDDIIPLLFEKLVSNSESEKQEKNNASWALINLGPRILPFTRQPLSNPNEGIGAETLSIILRITAENPDSIPDELIPLIVENLNNDSRADFKSGYELAANLLVGISPRSIPVLQTALLDNPDKVICAGATHIICRIAENEPGSIPDDMIPLLIDNLSNDNDTMFEYKIGTEHAADALTYLGARAIPHLKSRLFSNPDDKQRAALAYALFKITAVTPELISQDMLPFLIDTLSNEYKILGNTKPEGRIYAACALANLSTISLPDLKIALRSTDEKTRAGAIYAIHLIISNNPALMSSELSLLLIENFNNRDYISSFNGGEYAARIIEDLGAEAAPHLRIILSHSDSKIRATGTEIVNNIARENPENIPDDLIPLLIDNLNNDSSYSRPEGAMYASWVLAKLSPRSLPYVKEALSNADDKIRARAVDILETIYKENPELITDDFIPLIIENLNNNSANGYSYAATILQEMGPAAIPYLKEALSNANAEIRAGATYALRQIANEDPALMTDDLIPLLIDNLDNEAMISFNNGSEHAALILKEIGPRALPYLKPARFNPNFTIAQNARKLYKEIKSQEGEN